MEASPEEIGLKIKTIRVNKGLSMEEFGKLLNTSKGTVNNWEKGRNYPNRENLKFIAELGGLTVDELINPVEHFVLRKIESSYNAVDNDIVNLCVKCFKQMYELGFSIEELSYYIIQVYDYNQYSKDSDQNYLVNDPSSFKLYLENRLASFRRFLELDNIPTEARLFIHAAIRQDDILFMKIETLGI